MLPRLFQKNKEKGVAILLSLGVLSLVLLLAMGYAYSGQGTLQLSGVNNDLSRASLLAEAGVQRCIGFLQSNFDTVTPHSRFMEEDGRYYLASVSSSGLDVEDSLGVTYIDGQFLDSTDYDMTSVTWILDTTTIDTSDDADYSSSDVTVNGRFAYIILNETGKVDPTHLVDTSSDDGWVAEGYESARWGVSLAELSLAGVLDSEGLAHAFHHVDNSSADEVTPGQMPDATGWLSAAHIFRTHPGVSDADGADSIANLVFPWSLDDDKAKYWDDIDANGVLSDTELFDTLNVSTIGTTIDDTQLYDHLIRASDRNTRTDFSPWLRNRNTAFTIPDLRRIAAHTAVNIADAADADGIPRIRYVNGSAPYALQEAMPASYEVRVIGDEGQHMIGDLLLTLEIDRPAATTAVNITPRLQASMFSSVTTANFTGYLTVSYRYQVAGIILPGPPMIPPIVRTGTLEIAPGDWEHKAIPAEGANWAYRDTVITGPMETFDNGSSNSATLAVVLSLNDAIATDGTAARNTLDAIPARNVAMIDNTAGAMRVKVGETAFGYVNFHANRPEHNGWDNSTPLESRRTTMVSIESDILNPADVASDLPTFPASEDPQWLESNQLYSGKSAPRNSQFLFVSELGRVPVGYGYHLPPSSPPASPRIGGTLQFWQYNTDYENSYDGDLLNMLVDSEPITMGLVNANSPYPSVLSELFAESASTPGDAAADVITAWFDTPLSGAGDIARVVGVADKGVSSARDDLRAEQNIATFNSFISTRYNFFNVVVVSQALQEVDVDGDIEWDTGRYARIRGEQKVMATIARDTYDNSYRVLRLEQLNEE